MKKIQVVKNNVICNMNFKFVKDKSKIRTLYKSIKILKVKNIFELKNAKFMYFYFYYLLYENFDNYFKYACKRHDYKTKSITADNFYFKRAKS